MFVSSLVQCILIHRGLEIECCLITVEDVEPSVDLKWERLLYSRRVVGLGVNIHRDIIGLPV